MDPKDFTNGSGLLVREVQVRASADKREFTGIGVPYGDEIEHYFGRETFDPGSVELDPAGTRVLWQHREPIGVITSAEETPEGYRVTGKISATRTGDEAMTLLRDGVVRSLSISFEPHEWTVEKRDDGTEVIHFTRVTAREFSLVTFPAYDGAAVESIRKQHNPDKEAPVAETLTRADLDSALAPVIAKAEDAERAALLAGTRSPNAGVPEFRSMGEFLKAISSGDEAAAEFHRAYTGGEVADGILKDTHVGSFIKLVEDRRPFKGQFSTGALPATGMSVDFYQLAKDTTQVAEQVNEGDDLVYGNVKLTEANAPVKTYGGWTEFSRQAIERATVSALDTALTAMALKYARVTDAVTKAVFTNLVASKLADDDDASQYIELAGTPTAFDWIDTIIDAVEKFENNGFTLTRAHASKAVFKELVRLTSSERLLTDFNGSQGRTINEMDLGALSADLAGVKVNLLPNSGTEKLFAFSDPVAIKTLEQPGAPARLQDENIINLTKQFSIYGYNAVITPFPQAIVPVKFAA